MTAPDSAPIRRALAEDDIAALKALAATHAGFPAGGDGPDGPWIGLAVAIGGPASIRWMLESGASLAEAEDYDFTLLQTCLDRPGEDRYRILALLLAAGANPDLRGFNDWTALHHAAARDDLRAIRMQLDAGADRAIRTRIDDGTTAEEEARGLGRTEAADLIRDHAPPGPGTRRHRLTKGQRE